MKAVKRPPYRKIAEHVFAKHLGDLAPSVRDELATSLVRQWLANDGCAGLVTPTHNLWFRVAAKGDNFEAGFDKVERNWSRTLSQDWHVADEETPVLLHRLNLCQSVSCRTKKGVTIRLSIDPKERTVRCERQTEE